MKVDQENARKQMSRKSTKRKLGGLKKSGTIEIERIRDSERFIELFDAICTDCDIRQSMARNVAPFASDPKSKQLYIELHKRGVLHTTVLKVEEKVAASHSGLFTGNCIHLGLITHSSAFSDHSPGAVHLSMLSAISARSHLPSLT